ALPAAPRPGGPGRRPGAEHRRTPALARSAGRVALFDPAGMTVPGKRHPERVHVGAVPHTSGSHRRKLHAPSQALHPVAMDHLPQRPASDLLAALPATEWERLAPQLELVELSLGAVLYESGMAVRHVDLPPPAI